jgi:CubicO group peptidase (beta-lactamase class C family)
MLRNWSTEMSSTLTPYTWLVASGSKAPVVHLAPLAETQSTLTVERAMAWPDATWRVSTPEEQGVSSETLVRMLKLVQESQFNVHSVLIVRNGYLIAEAHVAPYGPDTRHAMYSATKSVTSAVLGIALNKGIVQSVDEKVLDSFPELSANLRDSRKKEMTLKDLLMMTTGLDWRETSVPLFSRKSSLAKMVKSNDPVRFVLERPMASQPGTTFNYSSGASHLLSAIVQRRSGESMASFAEDCLFAPLGITNYGWLADSDGVTQGAWGLELTPRDMAKFGYLFLRQGNWCGQQIIPADWVEESTTGRVTVSTRESRGARMRSYLLRRQGPRLPTIASVSYGYQWWVLSPDGCASRGRGGQAIFVIPGLDLVVVFTGGLGNGTAFVPEALLEGFVVPAVKSNEALPPNPDAFAKLQSNLRDLAHPDARAPEKLPSIATAIDSRTYTMAPNPSRVQTMTFKFGDGDEALMSLCQANSTAELRIGLDNNFRLTELTDHESVGLRGAWSEGNTFNLDWRFLHSGERVTSNLTFEGNRLKIESGASIDGRTTKLKGELSQN